MKRVYVKKTNAFDVNDSYVATSIEVQIEKMMSQEEPIVASMSYIGTERNEGVKPEYDIRSNRFEIAHEVMSKAAEAHENGRDFRRKGVEETKESSLSEANIGTSVTNNE